MYYFIVNPKSCSGRGEKIWNKIKQELDQKRIEYRSFLTEYQNHASEIAATICKDYEGTNHIVIVGGDGTVNEVINGIDNYRNVILGYIPSGSSNDLARSLKLPKKPIQALSHILSNKNFTYYDTGSITSKNSDTTRRFACSSGIGYDAGVCHEVQNSVIKRTLNKFHLGKLTYYVIACKQVLTKKSIDGTIYTDGKLKGTYKNLFMVTNMIHRYEGGGLLVTPDADPSDHKISVCLVHGYNRLQIFFLLPTILFGLHTRLKGVELFDCESIDIITDKDCYVHTDGEPAFLCSHVNISCTKEQIRFIV